MRKVLMCSAVALAFLAGCEASHSPTPPKWEGPPYRLTVGAQPATANPAGLTLPPIYYTANPEAVVTRTNLAIRIDITGVKKPAKLDKITDQLLLAPTDIGGNQGGLSDSYLASSSGELAKMLSAYCMNGKIKVKVALIKSSIMMSATNAQVDSHRLSDWQPIEIEFKNPHPKC